VRTTQLLQRDVLTRHVFPLLNERCRSRRVRVVPVDLRWGLTKEDTSDEGLGALEHCLLEIDHCRPFFLVLSGERYGWIPPGYRVSDAPQFQWVKDFEPNHSITAMEIFYGFVRKWSRPVHAFLYKRNPSFMKDITDPDERRVFAFDYADQPEVLARKQELLEAMVDHPYCRTRDYTCRYGGKDSSGKPHVTALQEFENAVLDDLWRAVQFEFPPPPPALSQLQKERQAHIQFQTVRCCCCCCGWVGGWVDGIGTRGSGCSWMLWTWVCVWDVAARVGADAHVAWGWA